MSGLSCQYIAAARQFDANEDELIGAVGKAVTLASALEGELGRMLEESHPEEYKKAAAFVREQCYKLEKWSDDMRGASKQLKKWVDLAGSWGS